MKNIKSQGLIIHDEEDDVIPYNDALLVKDSFNNASFISTKGLGHSYNNPKVTDYINEFIET